MPYHGVAPECEFLDRLGSYSVAGRLYSRRELLAGYLRGLAKRTVGFTVAQRAVLRERVQILLRAEA